VLLQLRHQGRLQRCGFHQIRAAWETRPVNPQPLHLADQRSALQAKFGRCAVQASDHPGGRFKGVQNQGAFAISKSSWRRRNGDSVSSSSRQRIGKHAKVGKDHGAFDQVCSSRIFPGQWYELSADIVSRGMCSICLPNRRPRISTKCVTSAGMSSRRSRRGGSWRGNTLRR
jgi:hypothetical protein